MTQNGDTCEIEEPKPPTAEPTQRKLRAQQRMLVIRSEAELIRAIRANPSHLKLLYKKELRAVAARAAAAPSFGGKMVWKNYAEKLKKDLKWWVVALGVDD
jgi:hypothetical protein